MAFPSVYRGYSVIYGSHAHACIKIIMISVFLIAVLLFLGIYLGRQFPTPQVID